MKKVLVELQEAADMDVLEQLLSAGLPSFQHSPTLPGGICHLSSDKEPACWFLRSPSFQS